MDCVGIVAEYNPFHLGHEYHINETKRLTGLPVIAIMSGSFVQRGEPAIADKWARAAWAVEGGADLVLELPVSYCLRSGESFARGAVATLAATGCVTHLSFGCEAEEPRLLEELASMEFPAEEIRALLATGLPYGASLGKLMASRNPAYKTLVKQPNNILALEYLRANKALGSPLTPVPIRRRGAGYENKDVGTALPSALAIREELARSGFAEQITAALPDATREGLKRYTAEALAARQERLLTLLNYELTKLDYAEIAARCDASEGLENKMAMAAPAASIDELLGKIKSKRYPASRIKRLLCQILISLPNLSFRETAGLAPAYIRILAFNDKGRKILRHMSRTAELPVLNSIRRNVFKRYDGEGFYKALRMEIAATEVYEQIVGSQVRNRDFTESPVYVKSRKGCEEINTKS